MQQGNQSITTKRSRLAPLAAAITLGLAGSLSAIDAARADAIFYPGFDTRDNWVTFVTVINKSAATSLHWVYRYDDPSTSGNDCLYLQGFGDTVPNDYLTVDVSNTLSGGMALPAGDTSSSGFNIGPGFDGYLMVYAFTGTYPAGATPENTLAGEAAVINLVTGEMYKLKANNDPNSISEANFDDMAYGAFGSSVGPGMYPTAIFHAPSAVPTEFDVVVVDFQAASSGVTPTSSIALADVNGNPGSFYDVNGNLIGGAATVDVTCFDHLTLSDLLPGAALAQAANGGWANVQIIDQDLMTAGTQPPGTLDRGIFVTKRETLASPTGGMYSGATSGNRVDF